MNHIYLYWNLWYNDLILGRKRPATEERQGRLQACYVRHGAEDTGLEKGVNMELKEDNGDGVDSWKEVTLIYNAALKMMETKMEILNDEFQHVHRYNPIEHIKARIKTPESIVKKLKRDGHESTIDNMVKYVNDIAGIRIICSFTSDIYRIVDMISEQRDIKVIGVKDYITFPKASGYKSYHMIVTVPVYLSDRTVDTKVEIQIRTVAMDFWASLEHKIHYKFEGDVPENIKSELVECARMVSDLDIRMLKLNEEILAKAIEDFHAAHKKAYGYRNDGAPVKLVSYRVAAIGLVEKPELKQRPVEQPVPAPTPFITRKVLFQGQLDYLDCGIYDRTTFLPGTQLSGPAIVEQMDCTTVIPPHWHVTVDGYSNMIAEFREDG